MSPTRGPSWHAAAPSGGTILLVEDDDDFARMLALYLGDEGYDVVTVEDGAQAVHTVFELEPDVILMDTHIPGLDGLQSTTRLRQFGYAGPIVALSAAPGDELKYQALQAGCDDFVSKPVDVDELLAAIRRRSRRSGGLSVSAHVAQQRLRSDFQSSFALKADRLDACWRAIECSDWGLSELQTLQRLVHRLAGSSGFY
ncbi:MAG: response regulator transcription factor, partial [Gammaproteobacteria bacterium]